MRPKSTVASALACCLGLAALCLGVAHAAIPATQRAVLVAIYNQTNGPNWYLPTNWLGAPGTECTWRGVYCDAGQNNVIALDLRAHNMTGTLPSLSGLVALQTFDVHADSTFVPPNQITGSIPSLTGLTALRSFDVSGNKMNGTMAGLAGLTSLETFNAADNQLTGPIPPLTGLTALKNFYVGRNRLTGAIPSLAGLTSLRQFLASSNQLTGSLPSLAGLPAFDSLEVFNNQLTGSIPPLTGVTTLAYFNVANNQLTGALPSLSGLNSLSIFQAQNNQLTGGIPPMSGLTALQWLDVGRNQLTGSIPALTGLTRLQRFIVNNNLLSGPVPAGAPSNFPGQSNLCINALTSSGNASIDAAWTTAAGNWLACQTAVVPPICTLTASPSTITAGTARAVTLTANCTGAPTSYTWSVPVNGVTLSAGTNPITANYPASMPPGTYTHSVTATNSGGTAIASATVTVLAAGPPSCTATATPNTFVSGTATTVNLAATCTNSPTSYSWSPSFGAPAVTGTGANVSAAFPASTAPGTYSYSLSATNASGTAGAVVQITVTSSTALPVCTATATPSSLTTGTAATVTLVAACTNSPTSYTWSTSAGAPAVSGNGATVTAIFASTTAAGTYTYTVRGTNSGGTGAAASATVTVSVAAATPACTLSAPAYFIVGQAPVTLTASCSPAATSYAWTGGTCNSTTGPTCVVSPADTTTYSVAGRNASGAGPADRKTVVVSRQVFTMAVTSSIQPQGMANATAQMQVRPQDVGATTSIYVFAHVPVTKLSAPSADLEKADGPDPCVLAQLLSNGQLVGVTYASMRAYLTAALSSQNQSVNILNNVPTPNVAGATFYVGYGPTATLMFTNGTYQGAVTVPGTTQCNTTVLGTAVPKTPDALTGLWYNSRESGWGVHFTQRRGIVFGAMYMYDSAGNPKWYVAPSCPMGSVSTSTGVCNGLLYEVAGPAFFGIPFNPAAVRPTLVGSLQVNFQNADNALMTYSVNAQGRTVAVTRQMFAPSSTPPAVDHTDLWWNPDESGWGLAVTQQFGTMFLAWYVYDGTGKPIWYVASNCVVSGSACSGDLYRTTGPPAGPSFDPARVQAFAAGSVSLTFIDPNNATLVYTVNGVREVKFIRRQEF